MKWAIDKLEDAKAEDIWGFRKWLKGTWNYPTPAINRLGQSPAILHEEKCEAMRAELFQPPPALPDEYHPDLKNELPGDLPFDEVREAIFEASPKSAPGHSQVSYQVIHWAWQEASELIYTLMKKCLQNGFHPWQWRMAVAVAL